MSTTRRDFLKHSSAAVAAGAALEGSRAEARDTQPAGASIPPHRPLEVDGLHAYAEKTLAAGDTVHLRVSSTVPYDLAICELGPDVDRRESDSALHTTRQAEARRQAIHPGSYVHVGKNLPADKSCEALSVELWVRPWRLNAQQGLLTQYNAPAACGLALAASARGELEFYLGDGGAFRPACLHAGPKLALDRWQHVVATWNGDTKTVWIDGKLAASWKSDVKARMGDAPLRIGASGEAGAADHFLDGDVAMPAVYAAALDADAVRARFEARALAAPGGVDLLACWPLSEERGSRVADASRHARHGEIVNHGTWMIGGPSFDAGKTDRYADYDPALDEHRGHGLRLASDDLYDCRWEVTHEYPLPASAKSGVYVAWFRYQRGGKPADYYVTFVVRKPAHAPKAPMVVLCSTNTWLAYGATPFASPPANPNWPTFGFASPAGAPAYSCYRDHKAGQPPYQFGLRMPWPVAAPDVLYSPPGVGYSHLMRGERFTHTWLERNGYDFDVVSDLDLDRDPQLLDGYKVLMINGHSEYWSKRAYRGVERFARAGGSLVMLSGNTMFWRVSFDDEQAVMECRKFDRRIGASARAGLGEMWHSHDGRRGSMMREAGMPAWQLVGLETIGWWSLGAEAFGTYRATAADHFLWHKPEEVGIAEGDTFGHAPGGGVPRAIGHEADVRLSTLKRMTKQPIPAGASMPDEPEGIVTLAYGVREEERDAIVLDYFARPAAALDKVFCEMVYWQRPQGGKVFHAGAIGSGWALSVDERFQKLLRNVLHHFGVEPDKPAGDKA